VADSDGDERSSACSLRVPLRIRNFHAIAIAPSMQLRRFHIGIVLTLR
jgi:hypothetical protein